MEQKKLLLVVNPVAGRIRVSEAFFEIGDEFVHSIRFGIEEQHLVAVEAIELLGIFFIEVVRDDFFRRILVFHVVQTVLGTEIGNAAVGGNTGAGKEHDVSGIVDNALQKCSCYLYLGYHTSYSVQKV